MIEFIRSIFNPKPNNREVAILERITEAKKRFPSMHVNKAGALEVDVKEILADKDFQDKAKKCAKIVREYNE